MAKKKTRRRRTKKTFEQEVMELAKEWQTRLRLLDWDIEVRVTDVEDQFDGSNWGQVSIHDSIRKAKVIIRHPSQIRSKNGFEEVLVHELIHLYLHDFPDSIEPQIELAINMITQAMMRLKYGEDYEPWTE